MLVTAVLLYAYYDKTWYPPDEGNYATVAQRVLNGEVLNGQVQDIHPGYITFVNAEALRLFGLDLLSLRYPLVLASLVQAGAILLVFPPEARWRAAVAAVGATALGAIQFLNPTAHWPCLALTTVLVALLARTPAIHRAARRSGTSDWHHRALSPAHRIFRRGRGSHLSHCGAAGRRRRRP